MLPETPHDKAWRLELQYNGRWKSHLALCSRCRGDDKCPQGSHLHHTWQHWLAQAKGSTP